MSSQYLSDGLNFLGSDAVQILRKSMSFPRVIAGSKKRTEIKPDRTLTAITRNRNSMEQICQADPWAALQRMLGFSGTLGMISTLGTWPGGCRMHGSGQKVIGKEN